MIPATRLAPAGENPAERTVWAMGILFFLSGGTSLVYQVVWMRQLSLFFGSDVYAVATTLSVFMAGLSLGSLLASRIGDSLRRPMIVYGAFEVVIGLYALVFPVVLFGMEGYYQAIYQHFFADAPLVYQSVRVGMSVLALLLPTVLMGATLPLFIRQFANREDKLGERVGFFYAMNTFGALCGVLASGFVMLPLLGVARTTHLTLAVNITIGGLTLLLALFGFFGDFGVSPRATSKAPVQSRDQRAVMIAIALSGAAALALEVVWTRILVQIFSGTVYAFASMLACFLLGLYWGSHVAAKKADHSANPLGTLLVLEGWLAGSVAFLAVAVYVAPAIFGILTWGLTGLTGGDFAVASIVSQFVVAGLLILGPTMLMGATFPFAVKAYSHDIHLRANATGLVYAANTAGAVLGALVGGFVLLPEVGSRWGLIAVACMFLAAALSLRRKADTAEESGPSPFHIGAPLALLGIAVGAVTILPHQTIVNYNMQRSTSPNVLYHAEGVAHSVDFVQTPDNNIIMMVNGNIEADTTFIQKRHFVLKALLPMLLHGQAKDVAVIGLGLGITTRAMLEFPGLERLRLIELSPEMVEAHRRHPAIADNVLQNPKLDLRIDDGRNFLAHSDEMFDIITADPIHPRITGVGYLYTREYYESIKRRLRPGGIVTQWMPMYQISPRSFDVAFRTFADSFPEALFWYVRGHGLFIGGTQPLVIDTQHLSTLLMDPTIRGTLASIDIHSPAQLMGLLTMDGPHIHAYLAGREVRAINTDDNAYLEYHTPFEFLGRTEGIISGLKPYVGWDGNAVVRGASAETKSELARQFGLRRDRLLEELNDPLR